jgi:long-chain acyl-CoA synthetase
MWNGNAPPRTKRWPRRTGASRIGLVALLAALACASATAASTRVVGIEVADHISLGGQTLLRNGAGVRRLFGFRVYVATLYLPAPMSEPARILARDTPKRLEITLLRDTSTEQNLDALKYGLRDNNRPEELATIQEQIDHFFALIRQVSEIPTGAVIQLDYLPNTGTRVRIAGRDLGSVPGNRFNRAILKIWLGDDPIQTSLKQSLLGLESPPL